jgi:hypothetical protein
MSASPAEQTLPTGVQRWTIIGTALVAAFVFSLNSRGSILESPVIVQAFALDHYKIQWITGAEALAGLTSLLASIYLIKLVGARRVFLPVLAGAVRHPRRVRRVPGPARAVHLSRRPARPPAGAPVRLRGRRLVRAHLRVRPVSRTCSPPKVGWILKTRTIY